MPKFEVPVFIRREQGTNRLVWRCLGRQTRRGLVPWSDAGAPRGTSIIRYGDGVALVDVQGQSSDASWTQIDDAAVQAWLEAHPAYTEDDLDPAQAHELVPQGA